MSIQVDFCPLKRPIPFSVTGGGREGNPAGGRGGGLALAEGGGTVATSSGYVNVEFNMETN